MKYNETSSQQKSDMSPMNWPQGPRLYNSTPRSRPITMGAPKKCFLPLSCLYQSYQNHESGKNNDICWYLLYNIYIFPVWLIKDHIILISLIFHYATFYSLLNSKIMCRCVTVMIVFIWVAFLLYLSASGVFQCEKTIARCFVSNVPCCSLVTINP